MKTCPRCNDELIETGATFTCAAALKWEWERQDKVGWTDPKPCDYSEIRTSFQVPEQNLTRLTDKIVKLQRKAHKLGFAAPELTITDIREERQIKREGIKVWVTFVTVEVSGEAPQINGWTFQATVDHDGEENVIRSIGGREKGEEAGFPVKYRTAGPVCEHCKLDRKRSETFLLKSEAGKWKQIGRTCLKDFLGHSDPASLASSAEYLAEAMEEAELCSVWGEEDFARGNPDIVYFLSYVALAVRLNGWTPRSAHNGEATADKAAEWMYGNAHCAKMREKIKFPSPEDRDRETAEAALEWARALEGDREFESNLRACSKRSGVAPKNSGITAYIVAGYLKAETAKHERAESNYIGEIGVRFGSGKGKKHIPEIQVTVIKVIEMFSEYGASYLHIMRDSAGNALKWKSSGTCLETGERYSLTGTVDAHEEYKGTKQTKLSRCKATRIVAEAQAA